MGRSKGMVKHCPYCNAGVELEDYDCVRYECKTAQTPIGMVRSTFCERTFNVIKETEAENKRLLATALIDNVVNASDEDILQEVLEDSGNSDHESNIMRSIIKGIKTTKQSSLTEQEKFERLSELMADKGVQQEAFELLADLHPARIRAETLREAAVVVDNDFKAQRKKMELEGLREDTPQVSAFLDGHRSAQLALAAVLSEEKQKC
jgi:hypothetical protein